MNLYDVKYLPTKDWVVGNRVTKKERKREIIDLQNISRKPL